MLANGKKANGEREWCFKMGMPQTRKPCSIGAITYIYNHNVSLNRKPMTENLATFHLFPTCIEISLVCSCSLYVSMLAFHIYLSLFPFLLCFFVGAQIFSKFLPHSFIILVFYPYPFPSLLLYIISHSCFAWCTRSFARITHTHVLK